MRKTLLTIIDLWFLQKNDKEKIKPPFLVLPFVFLLFSFSFANAATITSTGTGGDWSSPSTWVGGIVPTSSDDVVIASGTTVTISTNVVAKSITVSGTMSIVADLNVNINSELIVVKSPSGNIYFNKKSIIALPLNVALYLQNGSGSLTEDNGGCSNNTAIYVGTTMYAVCTGGGASYTFDTLETAGGINNTRPTSVISGAQTICNGGTTTNISVTLTGSQPWSLTYSDGTTPVTVAGITVSPYTFTVSPTSAKTYTVTALSDANCAAIATDMTGSAVITVNTLSTAPTGATGTTTICNGGSTTLTVSGGSAGTGATVEWFTGSCGGTSAGTGNSITVSPNSTTTYYVRYSGTCNTTTCGTVTVTVNALPTTPTTIVNSQPDCSGGIIFVDAGPGMTYSIDGSDYTNISGVFSGLSGGTYNATAKNKVTGCISLPSADVVLLPYDTTTWDGSAWDNGAPGINKSIVFDGNYSSSSDILGCSCQVNAGKKVTILSGGTLTITNTVSVAIGGTLTFENGASLIQTNDAAVNSGKIIYKRISSPMKNYDYTYWSSPVSGQKLNVLSPNTLSDKYYSFANDNWVNEPGSNSMDPGKGYIIRTPKAGTWPNGEVVGFPYSQPVQFEGKPNNGNITFAADVAGNFNLIGNPYPSALDANAFLDANSAVLDGTLYFWTHNTAIQLATNITNGSAGSGIYAYTSDDYASYNRVGGVATAAAPSAGTGGLNTNIPSGKIAAGQSFFVGSIAAGTVTFKNSMRLPGTTAGSANNSQFFKGAKSSNTEKVIEKNRIWLNLTNTQGAFKQTLIGYVTNATNGYDNGFDGQSFDGNQYVDFYSVSTDTNLTIQGRALPFSVADVIPLGYKTSIAGDFSINIDQADGLLKNLSVFIEDKNSGVVHNLKDGAYSFTTTAGTFNDRFVLRYTDKNGKSSLDAAGAGNQVLVSSKNQEIKINSLPVIINNVVIYDMAGRLIYQNNDVNSNQFSVSNLGLSQQVLIVKMTLQDGSTSTQEIIVQ